MTTIKRPGFAREDILDIDDIVTTASDGDAVGQVSIKEKPYQDLNDSEKASYLRDLLVLDTLEKILAEMRKQNFLLEQIADTGSVPVEIFNDSN